MSSHYVILGKLVYSYDMLTNRCIRAYVPQNISNISMCNVRQTYWKRKNKTFETVTEREE